MTDASPYTVPKEPGRWRAITLAALVHLALLVFLWIGVHWQNEEPTTIEAEVWSPQPREAAPQPEPAKAPEPEPKPVIKEPPKPKVVEPPVEKPDIALEREKKRKEEEKKRLEEERLAKEKKRLEEEKLAKLKQDEKEKTEKAKKEAAEKKRKQEEAETKMLAKIREEDMRRITGGVTGSGGGGDAQKAQGGRASTEYGNRIAAKIKSNITFIPPENLPGNPPVEYEVRLLPDGSVAGMRKLRSSGVPGFDEAVARAIERAQPFPRDTNGTVPPTFIGTHRPKDQ